MVKKQMKLGAFFFLPGHHVASWRHPQAEVHDTWTISYLTQLAQTAERGKFDNIFFADVFGQGVHESSLSGIKLDPLVIISALAAVTKNIGLTATLTTTYNEPFHVARKFAAIDHLSGGRAAWNVVTSQNENEAQLFGKEQHLQHANRYARAEEFVDVVKKLWHSIEAEALVIDKEKGQFLDITKTKKVEHEGKHFNVTGYLDTPSTPQGHPVIVQAGSSEAGKELAAKTAEVIFTAWQTLEDAQAFYQDVKSRLAKYGRSEEDLKVMPGVFITVAKTEEEARRKQKELNSYISPEVGLGYLSYFIGKDVTQLDPDSSIPDFGVNEEDVTNPNTRANIIKNTIIQNGFTTLRELYEHIAGARGHREIVGTPEQIADQLQEWFENGAADGFNIMPPTFPQGLNDIVDLVIPELQRRGLFRTEYEGTTLRENLGLKHPIAQQVVHTN
ncbi:LLM class flavin-dependent oxidoreductase [Lysinibacillus sp. KU-BSD001]|uniref:LLM class flavin-dependent oxidoreductase n=1 Tax=Lysinibacillus sp. KU-BSD001 TaxID=3141328 RepID=UPI0036EA3DB5